MPDSRLLQLGFSAGFIEYLKRDGDHSPLCFRCQAPFHCYSSAIMQRSIVPIWECGTTLVYFSEERQRFEKCSLENIDDIWECYPSAQCALAALFIDLLEDDTTDDMLRQIASTLSFAHIERLIAEANLNHGVNYASWRKAFPLTCNH